MRLGEATEIVSNLAAQQWGLLTAAQAREEGVSAVMLSRLVDRGVLLRVRHGVYASTSTPATAALEVRAQWLALNPHALAANRGHDHPLEAVVSHETAAQLHGIGDVPSEAITFTTPDRRQTRQPGVRLITAALSSNEVTNMEGLPVTSVGRTVFDLARAGHEPGHLIDMLANALSQHLATKDDLADALAPVAERFGTASNTAPAMRARLEELFPTRRADDDHLAHLMQQAIAPIQHQLREIFATAVPNLQRPAALTQVQLLALAAIDPHTLLPPALREQLEAQATTAAQTFRDVLPTTGTGGANWHREERSTTHNAEDHRDEDADEDA
ncbi:type IV toxin-antitoxin system AbiEi family antitoxin domain-containing protein [Rhodococcus pyridinivorans]|uniref:type IV toxin-antitoxin system AbiEi family antitoxin domain-containing protein n=1 Tax=Rhodococcus pyridinivorans TaxID=103816 RepID=UPI003AB06A69